MPPRFLNPTPSLPLSSHLPRHNVVVGQGGRGLPSLRTVAGAHRDAGRLERRERKVGHASSALDYVRQRREFDVLDGILVLVVQPVPIQGTAKLIRPRAEKELTDHTSSAWLHRLEQARRAGRAGGVRTGLDRMLDLVELSAQPIDGNKPSDFSVLILAECAFMRR